MADGEKPEAGQDCLEKAAAEFGGTLITGELDRRPRRAPDHGAENRALTALARVMAESPRDLLRRLVEAGLELCRADSAGVSILEDEGGRGVFRWHAAAGSFAPYLNATVPRDASPCGVVIERDRPLLFDRPARHFIFDGAELPVYETLLVPFHHEGRPVGTVWASANTPAREFDAEDARLLLSLSRFASAAFQLIRALDAAQAGRDELGRRVGERTAELEAANEVLRREAAERASAEEALRRNEAWLAALFEILPVGVGVVDADGRLLLSNHEMRHYLPTGVVPSRDDEVHKRWLALHPDGRRVERHDFPGARALRGESTVPGIEMLHTQDDGRGVWTRVAAVPNRDGEGRGAGAVLVVTDIDELKRSAEALRKRESHFRAVVHLVPALLWEMNPTGQEILWAPRWLEYTGLTMEQAQRGGWVETIHPEDRPNTARVLGDAHVAGREAEVEHRVRRHDGEYRWFLARELPIRDDRGRITHRLGAAIDIHDRRVAMEALRESEERLRKAISIETVGVIFFDTEGRIRGANEAFARMSGRPREAFEGGGVSWDELTPPEFMEVTHRSREEMVARGESTPYKKQSVRPDGSRWWGLCTGKCLSGTECVEFVIDITGRKGLEEALRRANEELEERIRGRTLELAEANVSLAAEARERASAEGSVKRLLRQLITVQEGEQRRVARELHDTLGQQLTALRLCIDMIKSESEGRARLRGHVERAQSIFDRLDADVDFLAWELRPAALDALGLDAALGTFVREWAEHFGIKARYRGLGDGAARLAPEVETNLYRILQEALQNVHKHAEASRVGVQLGRHDGRVVLAVEDDGRGFEPEAVGSSGGDKGMGLTNMRERAALCGGELEVESAPGAGTTVFVRIPVDETCGDGDGA